MKSLFVKSFKELDKKFIFVILADAAFYAALILAIILTLKMLSWSASTLGQIPFSALDIEKIASMSEFDKGIETTANLLEQFKSRASLSISAFIAMLVVIFSIFKGAGWGIAKKQKLNKKYFTQFFKLSFWWIAAIALVHIILYTMTKPSAGGFLAFLALVLAAYLMPISYALFKPDKKTKEIFKQVWAVGIEKFYRFIIPAIISLLLLLVLLNILGATRLFLSPTGTGIFLLFGLIIWQAWIKYYITLLVRGIK